jgi:hypothetical protein
LSFYIFAFLEKLFAQNAIITFFFSQNEKELSPFCDTA